MKCLHNRLTRTLCAIATLCLAAPSNHAAVSEFPNAIELGSGWYWDAGYGTFYGSYSPWIYHMEHGWQYIYSGGDYEVGGVYAWDHTLQDWWWVEANCYPWVYDFNNHEGWLQYQSGGSAGLRGFYWIATGGKESWYYETPYAIVDTNQTTCYDDTSDIDAPSSGETYFGQDAQYSGNQPNYTNNGDGTVTDNITGLMWQQTLDHNGDGSIDYADKLTYDEILALPATCTTGGYTDWRVPTIKEQYSLMMFSGRDVSGYEDDSTAGLTPFINTDYFGYNYGDTSAGERIIDVQCASTNVFVGSDMQMVFGVNFADGRIKGYGSTMMGQPKVFNYLLVRGNTEYGINHFVDNGDNTITDENTHLMWSKNDSGEGMIWADALSYAEAADVAGYTDWRLPNAKELQSIVDYTRSPQTTGSAAIDPLFHCTEITNEADGADYPFYWTGTTHASWGEVNQGGWGVYVAFGRAMGNESTSDLPPDDGMLPPDDSMLPPDDGMLPPDDGTTDTSEINWTDVHGAGAQRSDPKRGDPSEFSTGHGPQGDAVRIFNYVRLVRDAG